MPIKDPAKRKEYTSKYHREVWYPKNKARRLELNRANRDRIREHIKFVKLSRGCIDCGYRKYAEALDFDHIGEKLFDIGISAQQSISIKRINEEILKCEVVCANCHRVRTYKRRSQSIKSDTPHL
jgi:hypothetical protein